MHSATVPVMERLPQTSATGNVLIVDAERAMREGCRDVAQAAGYNVLMAESGEQACKLLDTQDVEIVLLELKLPGLGGVELLRQIKARRPSAILIVVTGSGSVRCS
jgi:DNA-binding response OmpR family regulator